MSARHSPEVRAAVMAALLAGQGVNETARQYKLLPSTVSRWRAKIPGATAKLEEHAETPHEFDELLANYLRETLQTLAVQVQFFRDTAWLAKQGASEVAILHGVITDKAIRLLEAAQAAGEREAEPPAPANE